MQPLLNHIDATKAIHPVHPVLYILNVLVIPPIPVLNNVIIDPVGRACFPPGGSVLSSSWTLILVCLSLIRSIRSIWLVSRSVGQSVSWSVGQSVSWSVGQSVSWSVGQ